MNILLVEDDDRISEFLVRGLHAEGHRIDLAKSGREGYNKAVSGKFDAIILDLMLPEMNGWDVCQSLRSQGVRTKIIMLTALEATSDIVKGLRMGADDYLTKPFAFDELLARLEVFDRAVSSDADRQTPASTTLQCGNIRFDTVTLTVTYNTTPIDLTSLEYSLLEFLMTEQGNVVSRARILQNVWGAHEDPLTNIVDVYIRRLRIKLSRVGANDTILTIRGRGYRLNSG